MPPRKKIAASPPGLRDERPYWSSSASTRRTCCAPLPRLPCRKRPDCSGRSDDRRLSTRRMSTSRSRARAGSRSSHTAPNTVGSRISAHHRARGRCEPFRAACSGIRALSWRALATVRRGPRGIRTRGSALGSVVVRRGQRHAILFCGSARIRVRTPVRRSRRAICAATLPRRRIALVSDNPTHLDRTSRRHPEPPVAGCSSPLILLCSSIAVCLVRSRPRHDRELFGRRPRARTFYPSLLSDLRDGVIAGVGSVSCSCRRSVLFSDRPD